MDIDSLLNSAEQKITWTAFSNMLNKIDLPKSHGYANTKVKLREKHSETTIAHEKFEMLKSYYIEHLKVGEKVSYFYKISNLLYHRTIIDYFLNKKPETHAYNKFYPYIVPNDLLREFPINQYFIANIEEDTNGIYVVFCVNRIREYRTEMNPSDISLEINNNYFNKYHKVIGIEEHPFQMFDILYIHKDKPIIELRIDISQKIRMRPQRVLTFLKSYITNLNQELFQNNLFSEILPLNPLYSAFYNEKTDAILVNLGFATDDIFDRYTFNDKASVDIRDTDFHKNAANKAKSIDPYKTGVKWIFEDGHSVLLVIPGTRKNIEIETNEAYFINCFTTFDYEFVLSKIFTYIRIHE